MRVKLVYVYNLTVRNYNRFYRLIKLRLWVRMLVISI